MARAAAKKVTAKKTKRGRKKKVSRFNLKKIVSVLLLAGFFFFSVAVLTYVVFFRMVVAAELGTAGDEVVFEEPGQPRSIPYGDMDVTGSREPRFAILIDDMGYHRQIGVDLIDLDLKLSFSFLPFAPFTAELEQKAYEKGRDILLHLPLQPEDTRWDPGPGALFVGQGDNRQRFLRSLRQVPHALGVNNHMGSLFTQNKTEMLQLLEQVGREKLFFLDSFTTPESVGFSMAQRLKIPSARRDLFLDNVTEVSAICRQIDELVKIATIRGRAIGIGHPHQQTYDAIQTCVDGIELEARLVGVTSLLD